MRRLFISLALVCATLGGAVASPGTAQAQGSDIDLAVSIEVPASITANKSESGPTITVTNRGSDTAYAVKVVIEADNNVSLDPTGHSPPREIAIPPIGSVALRDSKLIWSINRLPGKSAYEYTVLTAAWTSGIQIVQYVATVSSRGALEPEHNNRAEVFQVRKTGTFRALTPRYAVTVAVDNRFPQAQEDVSFTVTASNTAPRDTAHLRDARVTVPLPAGLTYKPATAPTGTTYNSSTGIWTIGDWDPSSSTNTHSLTLTATRAANTVLNEQCVTAKISAKPPEPLVQTADNRSRVCLGDEPRIVFGSGKADIFTLHNCVGQTNYPCGSSDSLEVVVSGYSTTNVATLDLTETALTERIQDIVGRWRQPESVVIHVKDPKARIAPVAGTGSVWSTGKVGDHGKAAEPFGSVSSIFALPTSGFSNYRFGMNKTAGDGYVKIYGASNNFLLLDSASQTSAGPIASLPATVIVFVEFEKLGTYTFDLTMSAEHTSGDCDANGDNTNESFCDTETYTFHVGPISELAVRDGGPSPDATSSQRAFTILALNNGPDHASAARVAVDLQGATVSQAIASQGSYSNGEWTIGALAVNDQTTAPTLTLITTDPVDTEITATITNAQDYEVCISSTGSDLSHTTQATCEAVTGASWHTTKYYDYISDNNTAIITAQTGTAPPTARVTVRWDPVAEASYYQIWRQGSPWELIADRRPAGFLLYQDSTAEPGRAYLYTIRAMDAQGIPIASQTVVAAAPGPARVVTQVQEVYPYGPNRLRASADGPTRIALRWTAPRTLYRRAVTSFEVEVSQDQDTWTTLEAYLEEARYTHTGLQPATTYYYRVYAHNRRGRSLASDVVGATTDPPRELTGALGLPPPPDSFQSGVGVLSGWVCEAEDVVIQINGTPVPVPYGLARPDTQAVCGDTDNGFSRPINWNQLGPGEHELIALVDGTELGRASVTVTTLGREFLSGASATCEVPDFPTPGETVSLVWQEAKQNFVLTDGRAPPTGPSAVAGDVPGYLENPAPNTFQSGVGLLSGWVCEAEAVTLEIAGQEYPVPYGLSRADTHGSCGDTANGFGMVFNWNELDDGDYEVIARADGVIFDRATVRVTMLGTAFLRDVAGTCEVPDFPETGQTVTLTWQEAQQNFVISGVE